MGNPLIGLGAFLVAGLSMITFSFIVTGFFQPALFAAGVAFIFFGAWHFIRPHGRNGSRRRL